MENGGSGLRVYKFGGASVKDAAGILNVCRIVQATRQGRPLLIVVSAMGKTTNALEEIFDLAWRGKDYAGQLAALAALHCQAARDIQATSSEVQSDVVGGVNDFFEDLRSLLKKANHASNFDEEYDQIISFGEKLSSFLLTAALARALPNQVIEYAATGLVKTDKSWREGRVDWAATTKTVREAAIKQVVATMGVAVTQGFIGGTADGRTTTLGREGSDYSAAIFAYCLEAESATIWKDVPGLLNADPKLFGDTVLYPEISYRETIEMAYYGASVIHPKTLQPLAERHIPLYVKSFLDPGAPGTVIHDCRHPALAPAFIRKTGQCLISFASKDFAFISEENLAVIFGALAVVRLKINVMQNSAISFSVGTDYHEGRVQQLMTRLGGQFRVQYNAGLTLFTIKHYDEASIGRLTAGRVLLLEQRTRSTFQFLVRE